MQGPALNLGFAGYEVRPAAGAHPEADPRPQGGNQGRPGSREVLDTTTALRNRPSRRQCPLEKELAYRGIIITGCFGGSKLGNVVGELQVEIKLRIVGEHLIHSLDITHRVLLLAMNEGPQLINLDQPSQSAILTRARQSLPDAGNPERTGQCKLMKWSPWIPNPVTSGNGWKLRGSMQLFI
jgi:hypothetical protein